MPLAELPQIEVQQGQCLEVRLTPGTSMNVTLPSGTVLNFDVTPDCLSVADQDGWIVLSEETQLGLSHPNAGWDRTYPTKKFVS